MITKTKIEVREVTTKAQLRKFVDFPNKLYRDVPQFVPAFYGDDLSDWDHKKNPAFEYCEARNFLAYKDGQIVGRIGAILSHKANETWGYNRMRFTQVDFIDDFEVSSALFRTVEDWAREKGCTQVHGPLGFSDMDREGMLVEGFDRQSMFITYYNFPYYIDHLTRLGYVKDVDWVEHLINVPTPEDEIGQKLEKWSQRVLSRGKYHKLELTKKSQITAKHIEMVFNLVNEAYAPLYGVVKLSETQIKKYAKKFVPLVNPNLLCLVLDSEDNLVAFGVCAPSVAKALKKSNGRLFPTGWARVLYAFNHNDTADLLLIAVRPDLQGSAINAVVMESIMKGANRMGILYAETGPTLEVNTKIQSQWKLFTKQQHKRRRCFIKDL